MRKGGREKDKEEKEDRRKGGREGYACGKSIGGTKVKW